MWSMIALLLLTTRLVVALPAIRPPIRKNTSWIEVGLPAWLAAEPGGPTCSRIGELTVPASKSSPAIFTPSTSDTAIGTMPLTGSSVAYPMPSTTVSARVTLIVWSIR